MHLPTLRAKRDLEARHDHAERKLRDATEAELAQEPDVVLEALESGGMWATWMTRQLAISELERRHGQRPDTYEGRPFDQEAPDAPSVAMDAVLAVLPAAPPQLHLIDPEPEAMRALRAAHKAYEMRFDEACPTCHGTGGGVYNDCPTCDGNGAVA